MSFSLRELLLLVFVAAFGLASFSIQSWAASLFLLHTILLLIGLLIVALVGYGDWRTFAIGFVAAGACYAAIIWFAQETELNPWKGQLLTTNAMGPLHNAINETTWVDVFTGQPVSAPPPGSAGGGFGAAGSGVARQSHDITLFTRTGHVLFTLLFGYLGGKFAIYIHRRSAPLNTEAPQT